MFIKPTIVPAPFVTEVTQNVGLIMRLWSEPLEVCAAEVVSAIVYAIAPVDAFLRYSLALMVGVDEALLNLPKKFPLYTVPSARAP
jgi:hypothetical protein